MTEQKLKIKFKKQIKKYQSWCIKYGYNSKSMFTLLWFFNQYKKAMKIDVEYYIIYKDKKYNVKELIGIFKNDKKEK